MIYNHIIYMITISIMKFINQNLFSLKFIIVHKLKILISILNFYFHCYYFYKSI